MKFPEPLSQTQQYGFRQGEIGERRDLVEMLLKGRSGRTGAECARLAQD
ncbi:MAG: hypothetical protein V2J20_02920 [Wenzhouxiangella sp.]|nr:hypothetical protein [Wenzhouxiangella sp.]